MQVSYNGVSPAAAPMGVVFDQQFAPQGFLGGALGSALGGLGGGALGRALGNQNLGRQIGSVAGGVLGGLLPFEAGPQAFPGTYYVPQTACAAGLRAAGLHRRCARRDRCAAWRRDRRPLRQRRPWSDDRRHGGRACPALPAVRGGAGVRAAGLSRRRASSAMRSARSVRRLAA